MRNRNRARVNRAAATAAAAAVVGVFGRSTALAAPTVDGTLDAAYGAPLAVQTNGTGFGKNTDASGSNSTGSELDAAYGFQQNGNLYLFFAGGVETGNTYNHLQLWIADGRAGQSTVNIATNQTLSAANGSKFSGGFQATYALDVNGGGGPPATEYVNGYDLTQATAPGSYIGNVAAGGAAGTLTNGIAFATNLSNVAGISGDPTTAASSAAASNVSTGFEIAIPLSVLGSPRGPIRVLADVAGGGDNYLSNQFLPGLPGTPGNVGGGGPNQLAGDSNGFDFSATPGQYFTVAAPASANTNGVWQATTGGSWTAAANWTDGKIPNAPGDAATFGATLTAPATVTLDGGKTVGSLTFNSPNSYTISAGTGGTLAINDTGDSAGVNPTISVQAGTHAISAPVALAAGVTINAGTATQLTLANVVSGTGPVNVAGTGTVVATAANTWTGGTAVAGGTFQTNTSAGLSTGPLMLGDPTADFVPATLALGAAGLTVANPIVTLQDDAGGNTFRLISGLYTAGNSTVSGPIQINGGLAVTAAAGGTVTVSGVISNGSAASQTGNTQAKFDVIANPVPASGANAPTGTVVLTGQEAYTGATVANAGVLTIAAAASIQGTAVVANVGGTLNVIGSINVNSDVVASGVVNFQPNPATPGYLPRLLDSLTINAGGKAVLVPSGVAANRTVVTTFGLTVANASSGVGYAGQLDVGTNDVVVYGPDPATILPLVAAGYANGTFAGQGITSSAAAANPERTTTVGVIVNADANGTALYNTFDGQPVRSADVLIKYTYYGDANLDGQVNGADYVRIDAGYAARNSASPLTGWYNGDFNYDGKVDGSDYTLIDNAFNLQATRLSSSVLATPTAEIAGGTAVPEPAAVGTAAVTAAAACARRRRGRAG